jgi:glycosyltransferase involved in cell wall biosynthesis
MSVDGAATPELTILMPCLDEAMTVVACVRKAGDYVRRSGIAAEILVADNGSTDGSQALASAAGARVIRVDARGYGAALRGGIAAAAGRFVIMADADDSYDLSDLDAFVEALRAGQQLVIGNRFKGGIHPGAMPVLNRYLGNPFLSFIGRTLFASPVGDFHCGIRGFERRAILDLDLRASGMEFASEMVVKAAIAELRIAEVPTILRPDGRDRPPHLRPWRDGWRHLRFMLLRSPRWLFLYPGIALASIGALGAALIAVKPRPIGALLTLDINALLYFSIAAIVGVQITYFGLFALSLARKLRLSVARGFSDTLLRAVAGEGAIALGVACVIAGLSGAIYAVFEWGHASFGPLVPSEVMRTTIPSVAVLAVGTQIVFGGFLLGFVEIE